jgi:collagenase-like PrtC family protease
MKPRIAIRGLESPEMKFSVGYQLADEGEEPFAEMVKDYLPHVAEVYFPWADLPSGRAALAVRRGYTDWNAQRRMEEDLLVLRRMGAKLDLLLNANCYGGLAASRHLQNQVASVLEHLGGLVGGVDAVTTASLAVARTVKQFFGKTEVRASVNMRIGTVHGMRYVADLFDGYCVQREFNRDLAHLAELKEWAGANRKRIHLLANSGCLAFCSGQTFHDNMVAHEKEIDETLNVPGWTPHVCWNLLKDRANWPAVLQATWIRPEDLHHYEGLFDVVKLATRMHANPRLVVAAYARGGHGGNLLDLLEPGFGPAFAPCFLDNTRFPADWFQRTSTCGRRCHKCDYCAKTLEQVLVQAETADPC